MQVDVADNCWESPNKERMVASLPDAPLPANPMLGLGLPSIKGEEADDAGASSSSSYDS